MTESKNCTHPTRHILDSVLSRAILGPFEIRHPLKKVRPPILYAGKGVKLLYLFLYIFYLGHRYAFVLAVDVTNHLSKNGERIVPIPMVTQTDEELACALNNTTNFRTSR